MKSELISGSVEKITERALSETRLTQFPEGTILFVVRGMILARSFPVGLTTTPVTINQDMRSIVPSKAVHPEYLLRILQHQGMRVLFEVKEATHGTLRLETETLQSWSIPIAPFAEQLRILEQLREAFRLIRSASSHVKNAGCILLESRGTSISSNINRLAQAILEKAFRGDLVPTEAEIARRENRAYESAEELLARVRSTATPTGKTKGRRKARKEELVEGEERAST